jgi:hypothetical protein
MLGQAGVKKMTRHTVDQESAISRIDAHISLTLRDQEALAAALAEEKINDPTGHVMDALTEYKDKVAVTGIVPFHPCTRAGRS